MKSALMLVAVATVAYGVGVPENIDLPEATTVVKAKFTVEVRQSILWLIHQHRCNGALIDGEHILAPAQCLENKPWYASFEVVVGSKVYGVRNITIHEKANNIANDIAVVRLSSAVMFSDKVLPINLPFPNAEYSKSATLYKRQSTGEVQAEDVTVKSRSDCTGTPGPISAGHICAGDKHKSALKGDEGSSLVVSDGLSGNILIGLLSFAKVEPAPAVFTKVSYHTDWILEKLQQDIY